MKKSYLAPGLQTEPLIPGMPLCVSNEYYTDGTTETLSEEEGYYQL